MRCFRCMWRFFLTWPEGLKLFHNLGRTILTPGTRAIHVQFVGRFVDWFVYVICISME